MAEEGQTEARVEIGNRIRITRRARKLSGQQLARKAGMSAGYLSEVERGLSAVSGEKLSRIAEALNVRVSYLLNEETSQETNEIRVPRALAEAAEELHLSYAATIRLLEGRHSLIARRASASNADWTTSQWITFYNNVKDYLGE